MLNKDNQRELAYIAQVTNIAPMDAERLECVYINGWTCVCGKGDFKIGDVGVFFEPDSKLPDVEPFNEIEFLKKKDFKIKAQKIRGVVSQGLFMPINAFGWVIDDADGSIIIPPEKYGETVVLNVGDFLTERLGVAYAVAEDNKRKAPSIDKYKKMAQRYPNLFKKRLFRWLMRRTWGKKLLFVFFGKKRDKRNSFPSWVVKTDEERVQNMPWLFNDREKRWIATEKIDGSSTTFTIKGFGRKQEFLVCSRNVCFDSPDKDGKCFYETNIYTEMAQKYNMKTLMQNALKTAHELDNKVEFLTIQAETFGKTVQKRDYGMNYHDMRVFNIIWGYKDGTTTRLNPIYGAKQAEIWGLPYVPIVNDYYYLPETCD